MVWHPPHHIAAEIWDVETVRTLFEGESRHRVSRLILCFSLYIYSHIHTHWPSCTPLLATKVKGKLLHQHQTSGSKKFTAHPGGITLSCHPWGITFITHRGGRSKSCVGGIHLVARHSANTPSGWPRKEPIILAHPLSKTHKCISHVSPRVCMITHSEWEVEADCWS